MSYLIDIQHASNDTIPVTDDVLMQWATLPLQNHQSCAELTVRLVTPEEIQTLNRQYRQQDKTTNVLAFPSHLPDTIELEVPFLGDIIICPQVLASESMNLNKSLTAHWAHITIHGVLHLLGYDHIEDEEAQKMQSLERQYLQALDFEDPYLTEEDKT